MAKAIAESGGELTSISKIGVSSRVVKCLLHRGISFVEELVMLSWDELLRIRNLGIVGANELNEKVKELGHVGWNRNSTA